MIDLLMLPTIVIVLAVLAAFGAWLVGATGSRAARLCFRNPRLIAPAAVLLGLELLLGVLPAGLAAPFFQQNVLGMGLGLSVPFLVSIAANILCLAWLIRDLAQVLHGRPFAFGRFVAPVFAVSVLGWVAILGSLALVMAVGAGAGGVFVPVIIAWGLGLFWLNSRMAPFVAALPVAGGGVKAIRAEMAEGFRAAPGRFRLAVAVHLLVLGLVTFVWLDGYTTQDAAGEHVHDATNFTVHGQYVLSLTLDSGWPDAIATSVDATVPAALELVLRLFMALLGTIFIAAYALLGLDHDEVGRG
jgi:hypothetical protein